MAVTLQDPTRQRDPSSPHAFPDLVGEPKLRAPRTLAEELLAVSRAETIEHERDQAVAHGEARTG
jgi:hypothetical protein